MNEISRFIETSTHGKSHKSYKYCMDSVEVPSVSYEYKRKRGGSGETDKGLGTPKSVEDVARFVSQDGEPLFKYFLDGSRRTYKVDDIAYDNRLYPVIAGQIGVGCCERPSPSEFKPVVMKLDRVVSLPACAYSGGHNNELFFNELVRKMNELPILQSKGLTFSKILPYEESIGQGEKYEHKGIEKIQDEMAESEKQVVDLLVRDRKLNTESFLLKDGSLEYRDLKDENPRDLSVIKSNYRCVVGASKAFNPEALASQDRNISRRIAALDVYHRTPAIMYQTGRTGNVKFAVWYLRIRGVSETVSPYDGVLKLEKVLISEEEEANGLDSDEVDRISANIINERNPVCYGKDSRWAKHLYSVYLTESFIKSKYLSDLHFENLF